MHLIEFVQCSQLCAKCVPWPFVLRRLGGPFVLRGWAANWQKLLQKRTLVRFMCEGLKQQGFPIGKRRKRIFDKIRTIFTIVG